MRGLNSVPPGQVSHATTAEPRDLGPLHSLDFAASQVYFQCTDPLNPASRVETPKCRVIVCKNPALSPGDIRSELSHGMQLSARVGLGARQSAVLTGGNASAALRVGVISTALTFLNFG